MRDEPGVRLKLSQAAAIIVIAALLVAPILIYIGTFGHAISDDHIRWSEMGSAMTGIYSPMIAFLALLVILGQLHSQNQINLHQFDQSYIQEARSDIQYYLEQLDRVLDTRDESGTTVRQVLHSAFQPKDITSLRSQEVADTAKTLNHMYPRVFAIWSAIYPILAGLRVPKKFPYEHNLSAVFQKIIVMISFETCVTLDNYHCCLTEGKTSITYEFSKSLVQHSEP